MVRLLVEKIIEGYAVECFLALCTDLCPDHSGDTVIGLITLAGLTGLQAVGQGYRSFECSHNITDRQLRRIPDKQISPCRSTDTLNQTCLAESVQDLLKV